MKTIICILLLTICVTAASAQTNVVLDGQYTGWVETGLYVAANDNVAIAASGCISFANGCGDACLSNPDGLNCMTGVDYSDQECVPACFLCTGEQQFSLVGRIGNGPCFVIGSEKLIPAASHDAGMLSIAYNDRVGYYGDNLGSFTVSITVTPAEPVGNGQMVINGSDAGWHPTGMVVSESDELVILASGCISFANGCGDECSSDPNGFSCAAGAPYSHDACAPTCFLCANANQFGLIGRIGGGPCFLVGESMTLPALSHGTGEIELAYNDRDGFYGDNSGTFDVTIAIVPSQPVAVEQQSWGAIKASYR